MIKVSVVIPLYNAEAFIEETLNCILQQTYKYFEVIIVDDASTDQSVAIVESYEDKRIKLFRNDRNRGIAYTRNRGVALSKGEYIALMDNDDLSPSTRLEKEVNYLNENAEMDVVCGHSRQIDENGNDLHKQRNTYLNPKYLKACLLFQDPIPNSSAMIRRSFVEKYQIQYQDNMYGAEDYRFWVECSLHGWIGSLDEVLLFWRNRKDNETALVLGEKREERRKAIAELQRYALTSHGFVLEESDIKILTKVFMEEGTIDSNDEMEALYLALKEIALQAKELNLDYAKEIVTMCRKRFGEKVGKAFYLWSA